MASTVNSVQLLGNIGNDPEIRYTKSGMMIASFSIATQTRKKSPTGDYEAITQWHNCTSFDKVAEIIGQYVKKGNKIFVSGSLDYQKYTSIEGHPVTATKILVNSITLLSRKEENATSSPTGANNHYQPPQQQQAAYDTNDLDDDIPF